MRRLALDAWDAAREVAPVVEAVTGLPLPARVTVRCTTIQGMRRQWRRRTRAQLRRDIARMDLDPASDPEVQQVRKHLRRESMSPKAITASIRVAILADGRTLLGPTGDPEVVIMPETWYMAGLCPAARRRAVAHELVHVAQRTAGGTQLRDALDSWVRNRYRGRGVDDPALRPVYEGQAYLADQHVLDKLGLQLSPPTPTPFYIKFMQRAGTATTQQVVSANSLTPGQEFVREVTARHGMSIINAMWTDPSLVPTYQQLTDPDGWAAAHSLS